ncbi:hypothetical protein [Nakamurella deserti]|uniref:hypothetical protein n=1 Tax=Nakamurella deserti TaxID=2164074 RepID=UPI000DBE7061|nr:hypothetical protein [Nakamurella deserti]
MGRRIGSLAAAAFLGGLVSVGVPGTAHACSCVDVSLAERLAENPEPVFVGRVTSVGEPVGWLHWSDATRWTFTVDTVYRGEVDRTVDVLVPPVCGTGYDDRPYLMLPTVHGGVLRESGCGVSLPLANVPAGVRAELGAGRPPAPDPTGFFSADPANVGSSPWLWAGAVTATVALVLAKAVVRRRLG